MTRQTILQHNTAFMNTAASMWRAGIETTLRPINPSIPKSQRTNSKRHRTSEQCAAEYWKARRAIEQIINRTPIDARGEEQDFIRVVARHSIFDHTSCSVYFGNGSRLGGVSFVHLLKSRDGTFRKPQATFLGEAGTRMAAASVLFFNYNGTSIPEAVLIYANRTIVKGPLAVSYRDLESYATSPHYAWKNQGCSLEEMKQTPTRVQKSALHKWFNQAEFETARQRIARVRNGAAYERIKEAVEAHNSWNDAAFSGFNRIQLEYVHRPWRNPNILVGGAANYRLPYLAHPVSKKRMLIGIPEGVTLRIDGAKKEPGVHIIKDRSILERGVQQLWFVGGTLTTPSAR